MKTLLQILKRIKKAPLLIFLFINFGCIYTGNAQWQNGLWIGKQANHFVYSGGAHLDFNTIPPATSFIPTT